LSVKSGSFKTSKILSLDRLANSLLELKAILPGVIALSIFIFISPEHGRYLSAGRIFLDPIITSGTRGIFDLIAEAKAPARNLSSPGSSVKVPSGNIANDSPLDAALINFLASLKLP
jgi:hypothetical protein